MYVHHTSSEYYIYGHNLTSDRAQIGKIREIITNYHIFYKNKVFLINFELNTNGNRWIGCPGTSPMLGCQSGRLLLHSAKNDYIDRSRFEKQLGFSCMLETNRPTQNDRNDQEIILGFWWKHDFISVFTDWIWFSDFLSGCSFSD